MINNLLSVVRAINRHVQGARCVGYIPSHQLKIQHYQYLFSIIYKIYFNQVIRKSLIEDEHNFLDTVLKFTSVGLGHKKNSMVYSRLLFRYPSTSIARAYKFWSLPLSFQSDIVF